ncbi:MAG TPA: phytanoyl-CoA dioxygenase family protein [Bryobacteraceae bacterium]|nr:phytanoyl-CoA dioxygenase [Bryobacterales bacterium]HRJ21124.1 phytanoyl-CoA dioxygenase family protein [Bryobacteraceae bacterium]
MTSEQRQQFEEIGFVVLPDVLDADWLRALRTRVEALFEQAGENAGHEFRAEPHARRMTVLLDNGEELARVAQHPEVLRLVEAALGPGFALADLEARSTNPFAPAPGPWRTGEDLWADGESCHVVWMLDDFTEECGVLRVAPGSHKWGRAPKEENPPELPLTGPAGSVAVLASKLWRSGTVNRTDRHRRALHGRFVR